MKQGKTILVVDDDEISLKIHRDMLTEAGFNVITADDGIDAYNKYIRNKPDMVITDVIMRNNGIELLTKIKSLNDGCPVITVSGGIGIDTGQTLLEISEGLGSDYNFQKPVDKKGLITVVNSFF
jgi:DNA-binding NtrC family response regulator